MLKSEELKDKNFKIFLGMPMYGGMLTEPTSKLDCHSRDWYENTNYGQ